MLVVALVGAVGTPARAAETTAPSPAPVRAHAAAAANGAVRTGLGSSKARITPSPASGSAVSSAEQVALRQAVAAGRSVPVPSETSETTQVAANPDGTFTLTSATVPVRVKKNGAWTPVDLNLVKNPDGTWGPSAAAHPVTFSGGGGGPLLTETDESSGKAISVSWPAALPEPAISANSATYPNVLPGVDLRVEAVDSGYRELLVVHDAAAAANPALRALAFRVTAGNGVDLSADGHGGLSARDRAKHASLFTESQPMEWDSTPGPLGAPGPDQIAATADLAPVASTSTANGTSATLGLAANPAAIRHRIVYPLYIDPEIQPGSTNYYEIADFGGAWPSSAGPTSLTAANGNKSPWNSELELGVCSLNCYYDWNGVGYNTYQDMDYFRFDTSSIGARDGENPNVYSAQFNGHVVGWGGGSSCSSTDAVALWAVTADIASTHPTWSSQYLNGKLQSGGGLCPGSTINLSAIGTNGYEPGYTQANLALTANYQSPDSGKNYWTISNSATLTVVYNFTPPAPATPTIQGAVTCTATTYVSAAAPTFGAVGADINPIPLDVQENFQVDNSAGTSTVESGTSAQVASGTSGPWTATTALTSGTAYEVRASTTNIVPAGTGGAPNLTGPESAWYPFTVLSAPPTAAPTIGSYDYPAGTWGQPSGSPATFTLGTNGAASIAGFAYSVDGGSGSEPVPATGDCGYLKDGGLGTSASPTKTGTFGTGSGELQLLSGGTAQLRVPSNLSPGRHTLYVRSFDLAHNASPESSYTFYVPADYQTASQPGTITAGDTLAATASGANASEVGTQTANCCGVTWYDGNQLFFNNTTSGDTFTVSFTVPDAGTWRLGADMTTAPDYAQLHIQLDGSTDLADTGHNPWDGYTSEVSLHFLDLGTPKLTAGTHTLAFTAVGKNSASSAYRAGLDYLELAPTGFYQAAQLASSLVPNGSGQNGTLATQGSTSDGWADNQQLFFSNSNLGSGFDLDFTAPIESDYTLGVNMTESWDYGELTFTLDPGTTNATVLDNSAGSPLDAYHASTVVTSHVFLGGMHLTAGSHVLQITVTGTDASSTGNRYDAGINYLQAVAVTGATDASFTTAMNNHGITSDGSSSPGDFDLTGASVGNNLSLQTLQSAGLTPGTSAAPGATFRLNGATFTMPQLAANGDDNVIVDGQTIPLPSANATGVALLLASTCGASPQGTATINYAAGGPHPSQATVASVPDWASGAAGTAVLVLPYRDIGSTVSTARQPRLYEQILPANPNGTLASITLPALSQTFLPATCPQALHLLALGTLTTGAAPPGTAWVGAAASPMDEAVTPAGGSFSDVTLREQVALGLTCATTNSCGGQVRVHLSNAHVNTSVSFDAATIAAQSTGSATLAAPVPLKFAGLPGVTIPAGGDVYSDPIAMPATGGGTGNLTISLHIPVTTTVTSAAVHEDVNMLTSYASGNDTTNSDGSPFTTANASTGDYYLAGIDATDTVTTDGTIAVLGDQTATNAPAGTAAPGTWAADLPAALANAGVNLPGGVANTSTGGSAPRPSAWWHLGEGSGSTVHDAGTGLNNATLAGGYSWTSGATPAGTNSSLTLSGYSSNGYGYAATSGPVLDTSASFTVSTWVNLSSTTNNAIAVAQDGTNDSGFYLGYLTGNGGEWDFYFMAADTTTPAWQAQANKTGATTGWTHLVGVYDASAKTARLYVNGALAATATGVTTWNAGGPLTIGRDKYNGGLADYWPGQISDVRAWNSALTGTQASAVYNDAGVSTLTSGNAMTAFEDATASEPNLRDVVISLGANDVLDGASATTIENNLRGLVTAVSGQYISDEPNAPVQPFITTIAPLGLPTSDPREQVRTTVNTWITNTYQGGQGIDIAASTANGGVADPANPNQIAPSLLTGTTPTAAYYTQIATDVASTIAGAVPPIQLIAKRELLP